MSNSIIGFCNVQFNISDSAIFFRLSIVKRLSVGKQVKSFKIGRFPAALVELTGLKQWIQLIMSRVSSWNKKLHVFFISNTFILAKNPAKVKQHPEAELLLFESYSLSSSTLWPKINKRYSKQCTKNKRVCFNEVIWLMAMKMSRKWKISHIVTT